MKPYVHNPELFKRHLQGKALPSFEGQRVQRGQGAKFDFIKRLATPLIGALAPHVAGAASKLAKTAVRTVFPNHPKMQRVVGNVVQAGANAAVKTLQKKRKSSTTVRTPLKRRKRAQRNIFYE